MSAAAAVVSILAVVLLSQTPYGTVKIELSDPNAQVEVKVDGEVIDIAGLAQPLRLKAGQHDLLVTAGDYQSVSKSFIVRRGVEEVLRVTLEPKVEPRENASAPEVAAKPPAPRPESIAKMEQSGSVEKQPMPSAVAKTDTAAPPQSCLQEITVDLGNGVNLQMVLIPAGEFMMGSADSDAKARADEKPQHRVRITRPFWLGRYEVTQEQWEAVMGTRPWRGQSYVKEGSDYPATYVSWNDAIAFCQKLTTQEGSTYRLPTEAEWEYACRGGTTSAYYFGDDPSRLDDYAWVNVKHEQFAHVVGQKKPNPFGLYDMHGNVIEWCADWLGEDYYARSSMDDPTGPAYIYARRVYRGGTWSGDPSGCRVSRREGNDANTRQLSIGFRLASTVSSR